jgi:hypothetical protein
VSAFGVQVDEDALHLRRQVDFAGDPHFQFARRLLVVEQLVKRRAAFHQEEREHPKSSGDAI